MQVQKSSKEKPSYSLPTVKKLLEEKRKQETSSTPPACAVASISGTTGPVSASTSDSSAGANSSYSDMTAMRNEQWELPMSLQPPAFLEPTLYSSMSANYSPLNFLPGPYSSCLTNAEPQVSNYSLLQDCQDGQISHQFSNSESQDPSVMPGASASMPGVSESMSVQNYASPWSPLIRAQSSSGPSSIFRPLMDRAKLEEAQVFLRTMDYNRTVWQDDDGDTMLHIYTAKGQREYAFAAAEKLKELGTLDSKEHKGKTALLVAVTANQPEIVLDLLFLGADISICDIKGQTALHLAATYGYPQVMEVILSMKHCLDLEARNFEGLTPLHCAVISHNSTMKTIASASSSASAWISDGLQSQANNKLFCLKMLLNAGASPLSQEIKSNKTVLHLAVKEGNIELVQFFLKLQLPDIQAFINMKAHGHTALHMAAGLHGNPYQEQLIRLLLSRGADPSIRNLENDQPVHLLQSGEQGEKLKLILKKRNAPSRRRITSLQDNE